MGSGQGISWTRVILGGTIALAIAAALLALVGPLLLIQLSGGDHYQVRSASMAPTLLVGDWVLARPFEPGTAPPRGAIVAYQAPNQAGSVYINRILGLPGERVQMRGGALYINGRRAGMERLQDHVIPNRPPARYSDWPDCVNAPVKIDEDCHQELWRETLPDGTTTLVLNARGKIGLFQPGSRSAGDDTTLLRIPDDAVFVIGDNRDASLDSRHPDHGMVPFADLEHQVWMIHSSLDKSSRFFHPRWDRFFRRVE
jgi:signal peptidase I